MEILRKIRHSKWFDTIYKIGVGIKGFDGLIELLVGILLIFSPHTPHRLLQHAAHFSQAHDSTFFHWLAHTVIKLDADLTGQTLLFVILFLISHGVIKLVLVYCLLKEYYRIYPYALAVLFIMLIIQIIPLFKDPTSPGLWLFTILDIVIIYLVWGEYLDLREKIAKSVKPKSETP